MTIAFIALTPLVIKMSGQKLSDVLAGGQVVEWKTFEVSMASIEDSMASFIVI